jgi:hypothetical protein
MNFLLVVVLLLLLVASSISSDTSFLRRRRHLQDDLEAPYVWKPEVSLAEIVPLAEVSSPEIPVSDISASEVSSPEVAMPGISEEIVSQEDEPVIPSSEVVQTQPDESLIPSLSEEIENQEDESISVGPPLTIGCPQIAPKQNDTCTEYQQQCRYPILSIDEKAASLYLNPFKSFWTCNCNSQDGKYNCAVRCDGNDCDVPVNQNQNPSPDPDPAATTPVTVTTPPAIGDDVPVVDVLVSCPDGYPFTGTPCTASQLFCGVYQISIPEEGAISYQACSCDQMTSLFDCFELERLFPKSDAPVLSTTAPVPEPVPATTAPVPTPVPGASVAVIATIAPVPAPVPATTAPVPVPVPVPVPATTATVPVPVPVPVLQDNDAEVLSTKVRDPALPQNILDGPINNEADTCPFQPPVSFNECFGSSEGSTTWIQCIYAIEGELRDYWTCNCGADSIFFCAKRGPSQADDPVPSSTVPAPAPVPVEIIDKEPNGVDDEEVLSSSAEEEVRPQNIMNDPINTESDTCPFAPPYSNDICFGSSEGSFTWKQCIYNIVGESSLHWTCNCGTDSLFDCAKRGF